MFKCVDPPGLEPRPREPKSLVLPLHHGSIPITNDEFVSRKERQK